jgi:hypothetical protein
VESDVATAALAPDQLQPTPPSVGPQNFAKICRENITPGQQPDKHFSPSHRQLVEILATRTAQVSECDDMTADMAKLRLTKSPKTAT